MRCLFPTVLSLLDCFCSVRCVFSFLSLIFLHLLSFCSCWRLSLSRAEVVQGKGQGESGQPGAFQRGHVRPLPGGGAQGETHYVVQSPFFRELFFLFWVRMPSMYSMYSTTSVGSWSSRHAPSSLHDLSSRPSCLCLLCLVGAWASDVDIS